MADLPKIDSEGLRLAKRESAKRVSSVVRACKNHRWSAWEVVGYTGDWFHPTIVERKCVCGATQQDEH